jgi:ornithine cyclodeaminase/alanine dehydrogenase-like protein (mu-crystallin family)
VAARPHVQTDPGFLPGTTVLQVSLRDLSEEIILGAHNIVDDVQHVCRAQTSVHLTEQLTGNRGFIAGTLADVISDPAKARTQGKPTIFSPFGLGILDLAVADYVLTCALKQGLGTELRDFYLEPLKILTY